MNLSGYAELQRTVLELTGIDLNAYKDNQLERRLQTLLRQSGEPDLRRYAESLRRSTERLRHFCSFLTINTSEWLRNTERFEYLQQVVLPDLTARSPYLSVWSAGCANGAEPYSVAMLLYELDPGRKHRILATDLDAEILEAARAGVYTEQDLRAVSSERRRRHLEALPGSRWTVRPHLRQMVSFARHNLLADPYPGEQDLILCRNVVIYFTEEAKADIYRRFSQALKPGGVLFVGGTESLFGACEIGLAPIAPFFYRKER